MTDNTCMWTGRDYTDSVQTDKTISINFVDCESAQLFFESVKVWTCNYFIEHVRVRANS